VSAQERKPPTVFILSGSTGRTCEEVLQAALAQFAESDIRLAYRTYVRTPEAAVRVVEDAAKEGAAICHSLVAPQVREAVVQEAAKRQVPMVDALGPTVAMLQDYLGQMPLLQAGLSRQLHKERFDRMDAVDYTLKHDDGLRMEELPQADVVIVGASRVSKSVTCFYLAARGIRAANVPLIADTEPPQELVSVNRAKIIGLTMNPGRLQKLRETRAQRMGKADLRAYSDLQEIERELRYAESLMEKHGWRRVDVSYMSVEEVASEIAAMVRA
jgi:regulator of PEP synthase PpsR (kinase-PPPase family)